MGWSRPHSIVVEERLLSWFLTKRTFPMTLDQLAEVVRNTSGPAHIKNYTEYLTLQKQIRELNNPKLSGVVHAK
jgi:hypothetical protein